MTASNHATEDDHHHVALHEEWMDLRAFRALRDAGATWAEIARETGHDLDGLEDAVVAAAAYAYGFRRGISYSACRSAGVLPSVLRRAGSAGRSRGSDS